jgi:hypothetical protein
MGRPPLGERAMTAAVIIVKQNCVPSPDDLLMPAKGSGAAGPEILPSIKQMRAHSMGPHVDRWALAPMVVGCIVVQPASAVAHDGVRRASAGITGG